MEQIHICSTCIVRPSRTNNSDSKRIELTPWDLHFLLFDYFQRGLLFPKPAQDELSSVIENLKISLSLTLDIFSPFAGRLGTIQNDDGTNSFYVDCNNAGAKFVHAKVAANADHLLKAVTVPAIVYSFFQMNGVRSYEGISKPLLAIQVTELTDGLFIGCSHNHMVADGASLWHFLNAWSEVCRNSDHRQVLRPPLNMGHWFLDGIDKPIKLPFSITDSDRLVPHPWQKRHFHFSKEKIALLKAKANGEIGNTARISSLQAILGHLWKSVVRNQNFDAQQEVHCNCIVNMRQRLIPPLGEQYFGNVVLVAPVKTTAGELLRRGLGWVALQINNKIASQTNEEAMKQLVAWVEKPFLPRIDGGWPKNVLTVGSSPRFKVYENDFGWGKPVGVRTGAGNNIVGLVGLDPGLEEGSVELFISLSPETLQALGKDAEFMEVVSN